MKSRASRWVWASAYTVGRSSTEPFQRVGVLSEIFLVPVGIIGYAITDKRTIAINPVAYDPIKTSFHECAHVLLHPNTASSDNKTLARDVKEVEAELTAYLTCSSLGKTDKLEYSRGYIQNWIGDGTVEKVRFGKVFAAADAILKAGRIEPERPSLTGSSLEGTAPASTL